MQNKAERKYLEEWRKFVHEGEHIAKMDKRKVDNSTNQHEEDGVDVLNLNKAKGR